MGIHAACVLAAGKGTRMHSSRPKVLQTLLGEPMVRYVLAALEPHFADNIWLVVGHGAEEVQKAVPIAVSCCRASSWGQGMPWPAPCRF